MTQSERIILEIMSSHIIGNNKVPSLNMPILKGLEKFGYVELLKEIDIWHITKAGRDALEPNR